MKKTPLRSRSAPLRSREPARGGAIKRKKRTPSEFARIYGSKARVRFVKSLPCANCGLRASDHSNWLAVVNAHIETDGTSRKAGYKRIIPLCTTLYRTGCHDKQHDHDWTALSKLSTPELAEVAAEYTEFLWQSHLRQTGRARQETE